MKRTDINIRDPFVLVKDGRCYMYGTRGAGFGRHTGGFDVYISTDLEEWEGPISCFDSNQWGMDRQVNWAPEVKEYNGAYYMTATFTRECGLRGTYVLKADRPEGPFVPHSQGAVTPEAWECLDGTLYVMRGKPYMVFCHEHTQILNGTVCYVELSEDLTHAVGEPVLLFDAASTGVSDALDGGHYVTDGPFMTRTDAGRLIMIWSSFIGGNYTENQVLFADDLDSSFTHLAPILTDDGGHGMVFTWKGVKYLTVHTPNESEKERPVFLPLKDLGDAWAAEGKA